MIEDYIAFICISVASLAVHAWALGEDYQDRILRYVLPMGLQAVIISACLHQLYYGVVRP